MRPSWRVAGAAVLGGVFVLLSSSTASAFCRTTTCNADLVDCGKTADKCAVLGEPLFWPDLCVTFGVHVDGSPLRNISYTKALNAAEAAFQNWISVDCGGGDHPYIGVVSKGKIYCDKLEFNHGGKNEDGSQANTQGPNANLIVFRDDAWPYNDENHTIALTTITFVKRTGEILDADIEVNSYGVPLSTSDTVITSDLQSILTHEVGHFFGLSHTLAEDATMNKNYDPGDKSFRSLSPDDADGICSIYPPVPGEVVDDCTGEGPRYGFTRYCGSLAEADAGLTCAVAATGAHAVQASEHPESRSSNAWLAALGVLGAAVGVGYRRRRALARRTP